MISTLSRITYLLTGECNHRDKTFLITEYKEGQKGLIQCDRCKKVMQL